MAMKRFRKHPPQRYQFRARIAKALAHPSRLLMLDALAERETCVCELTELVGADQSTVSKHLAILRNVGVVDDDRRGNTVFYRLLTPCVLDFFACAAAVIRERR